MKKILFFMISCLIICGIVGCRPINAPTNEELKLLELGLSNIGKPNGEQLLKELRAMGYDMEEVTFEGYENSTFYIDVKRHEKDLLFNLSITISNDTITRFYHTYAFRSKYVEAANRYLVMSDFVHNSGDNWIQWMGHASCVKDYDHDLDRPTFIEKLKENIKTYTWASVSMEEEWICPYEEKILCNKLSYGGGSIGGQNIFTGEAILPTAELNVFIEFTIRDADFRLYQE